MSRHLFRFTLVAEHTHVLFWTLGAPTQVSSKADIPEQTSSYMEVKLNAEPIEQFFARILLLHQACPFMLSSLLRTFSRYPSESLPSEAKMLCFICGSNDAENCGCDIWPTEPRERPEAAAQRVAQAIARLEITSPGTLLLEDRSLPTRSGSNEQLDFQRGPQIDPSAPSRQRQITESRREGAYQTNRSGSSSQSNAGLRRQETSRGGPTQIQALPGPQTFRSGGRTGRHGSRVPQAYQSGSNRQQTLPSAVVRSDRGLQASQGGSSTRPDAVRGGPQGSLDGSSQRQAAQDPQASQRGASQQHTARPSRSDPGSGRGSLDASVVEAANTP
jgi:hypothetical protein